MLSLLQGDNSDSLKFTRRESNGTVIGLDQPDYGVNGSFLGLPNPYPVHQSPGKNHPIPIMAISEEYILGQLSTNKSTNATSSHSNQTFTGGNAQSKRKSLLSRGFTKILPLNKRDGPIQCGPGSPCLDGSCCNSDGKCGYGSSHCNSTVCISNCDATAMCGRDSLNGTVQCGLNICCSYYGWCGTTDTYCGNPDGLSPCQANFGSCQVISDPSCSASGGSSSGRTIGYYQSWYFSRNMRNRLCNKVMPSQIITDGLTHLNFAFLYFDPITFRAVPMDDADLLLYSAFTALKKPGHSLQTWISVGGWAFSDPGPTQHAWSDMVASSANRYQFISSLISFMTQYGFDGADLDWEYPSAEARGGRSGDAANFVTLVKEMKSAFNGYFGLSAVLAPDYTYISGSDPKGMEPYVDFFGFMAYDLHGAWDKSIPSLGAHVRAQTDIRDIDNDLRPLWFDGVDPSKINLGLAYYGRTYTLSDPSCGTFNCSYEDYGRAKFCTNFAGVLSLQEIKSMVSANDITPTLSNEAMVKYATYDTDQWVGYDDEETLALKRAYANSKCLGGTMIWSIDFYGNGSGNVPQSGAGVEHMSPTSATVIPLPVTSVASTATFTVDNPAASNVAVLSNEGDQNLPPGPGFANCNYCDLMRLITSTCCGIGGSVANPILILPEVPLPADLVLPAGFQPSSGFYSNAGIYYPPYTPLPNTVTIPSGTKFPVAFPIPAGYGLNEGGSNSTAVVVYINTTFWQNPPYVVSCSYPCTFVLPPYPVQTTWTPPATTTTIDGTTITTQPPVQTSEHIYVSKITVHTTDPATKTTSITTGDPACPVYTIPLALFDLPITVCPPPPLPPFPPAISLEFPGIPPPPITILSAPTPGPTTPGNVPPDNPEEENDDEENDESCPIDGSPEFSDDEPDDNNSYNDNTGSGTDTSVPPFTPTVVTSVTVTTTTLPPPPPTTITETVVITATPTATRPPAPPEPPTPQPGTQQLHCFNSGNSENRAYMINAIEGFCTGGRDKNWNELIPPDGTVSNDVFFLYSMWVTDKSIIQVSIQAKNGCSFKLQGGSATQYCGKMLRRLVDECNTNDVKYKQGGTLEDNCSLWTMDPGEIFGPVNNPCYKRGVPGPWPSCDFWTGTPKYTCGWCP
ncbi:glycoside hydrolase family 18 protein, partial [Lepidopterella palustris CBS 459.81]